MLDRGLRRRFDPLVERRGARGSRHACPTDRASTCATCPRSRSTRRRRATSTTRSPPSGSTTARCACGCTSPTSPRTCGRARRVEREAFRRATIVYVPGAVEPMLPEALSNRACSLRAGRGPAGGDGRDGARGREACGGWRSTARSIRSRQAARPTRGGRDLRRPPSAPRSRGRRRSAAARQVAARSRTRARRRRAGRSSRGARVRVLARGPRDRRCATSEQTESHRLIEHLMIAANEAVATLLESRKLPDALPRARAARAAARGAPGRAARVARHPDAAAAREHDAAAGGRRGRRDRARRRRRRCGAATATAGSRSPRSSCGRSSRRTTRRATSATPACARQRYCHFTSPIRRYPDLVCHRALLSAIGAGEDAPAASRLEAAAEWCSQRERDAMSIERAADAVARCFLLEAALFERGWHSEWPGEVAGVIGAGAFVAFGDGHEGLLPVRRLRARLVGPQRARDDARRRGQRESDPSRRPGHRPGRARRRGPRPRRPVAGRDLSTRGRSTRERARRASAARTRGSRGRSRRSTPDRRR